MRILAAAGAGLRGGVVMGLVVAVVRAEDARPRPDALPKPVVSLLEADRIARERATSATLIVDSERIRMPDRLRRQQLPWTVTHRTQVLRMEPPAAELLVMPLEGDWRAARLDLAPPWPARWYHDPGAPAPVEELARDGAATARRPVDRASPLGGMLQQLFDDAATAGLPDGGVLRGLRGWQEETTTTLFGWNESVGEEPAHAVWLQLTGEGDDVAVTRELVVTWSPSPARATLRETLFEGHAAGPDGVRRATSWISTTWEVPAPERPALARLRGPGGAARLEALRTRLDASEQMPNETSATLRVEAPWLGTPIGFGAGDR